MEEERKRNLDIINEVNLQYILIILIYFLVAKLLYDYFSVRNVKKQCDFIGCLDKTIEFFLRRFS